MRQNRFGKGMCAGRGDGAGMEPSNGRGPGRSKGMHRAPHACIWEYPLAEPELLNHHKTILEERLRFVNELIEKSGKDAQTPQV